MLTCNSCMKRCLQNLIGDSATFSSPSTASVKHSLPACQSRTLYSSATSRPYKQDHEVPYSGPRNVVKTDRQKWLASRGTRPPDKIAQVPDTNFLVRKHLQYLKDPLKLADFVRDALRKDEYETTLEVVRSASRSLQCTVSWNHLIDYTLMKGKMNAAIKIYNEMKKRAQTPDAVTFTILFRGCAEHPDKEHALEKVLSIYRSMLLDKSPIKPTTIHINAVLKMCARAGDMDAIVATAADMPHRGPGSPDSTTYTTIINALRMDAISNAPEGSPEFTPMQIRNNTRLATMNGRLVWKEVTKRWSRGDLWIDEELVCAMGRLLLVGGRLQDQDDIFSLLEQAMNIPRQFPRMVEDPNPAPTKEYQLGEDDGSVPLQLEALNISNDKGGSESEPFTPIGVKNDAGKSVAKTGIHAKPGRNTLSLTMSALLKLHKAASREPAKKYWQQFTAVQGIRPDKENFLAYLRILRVARSSSEVVELLQTIPRAEMAHSTFRIAISTCVRDRRNIHAFSNAGKVLDLMQQAMKVPDIPVCEAYLEVAVTSKPPHTGGESQITQKAAQGKQILRALDRLRPHFDNLCSDLSYGEPTIRTSRRDNDETRRHILGLAQKMISAIDILREEGFVPEELRAELKRRHETLMRFISRSRPAVSLQIRNSASHQNKYDVSTEGGANGEEESSPSLLQLRRVSVD